MAIDCLRRCRVAADLGAAKESRPSASWVVAGGLVQVPHPVFAIYRAGQSCLQADSSGSGAVQFIRCDGPGQSALHGTGSRSCECRRSQAAPGSSVRHMGRRIHRDHLFVVGSLATHPGCCSRRVARGSQHPSQDDVLTHSPGTRCFRHLPPRPPAARRHLRPPDASTTPSCDRDTNFATSATATISSRRFTCSSKPFSGSILWCGGSESGWSRSASAPATKKSCEISAEPKVYAEGILNVCKLYVESPLTCVSGSHRGGSQEENRGDHDQPRRA